jgi:PleD family two-component response regulator
MDLKEANQNDPAPIVAIAADLMFASRIRSTAQAVGGDLHLARTAADVKRLASELRPRLVIIDLDIRSLDPVALITDLKGDPATSPVRILSYVSHVREDLIEAARQAGAEVIARGAFNRNLPAILTP